MKKLQKNVKCKSYTVIHNTNQQAKLPKPLKKTSEIIEKIEKLINYNLTFSLMMMLQLETQENTIGKMPAVIFKLLAVIGVHKSIFKKLPIKVVLIHINKNKIKWPLKYYQKLIIVIMLHYKEQILIWITCMPNLIQEEQSWRVNKKTNKREPTTQIQMQTHLKTH